MTTALLLFLPSAIFLWIRAVQSWQSRSIYHGLESPYEMNFATDGTSLHLAGLAYDDNPLRVRFIRCNVSNLSMEQTIPPMDLNHLANFDYRWQQSEQEIEEKTSRMSLRNEAGKTFILTPPTTHGKRWSGLGWSPDGSFFMMWRNDGLPAQWLLWDTKTGKLQQQITVGGGDCYSPKFTPQNRYLIGSGEKALQIWEVKTGKRLFQHPPVRHASLSPNGTTLAFLELQARRLKLLSVPQGHMKNQFELPLVSQEEIEDVAFEPHGPLIAMAINAPDRRGAEIMEGDNNRILLWDAKTGQIKHTLRLGAGMPLDNPTFSPDGTIIATISRTDTGYIHLWDVSTGKLRRSLKGKNEYPHTLLFSPDGATLVSDSRDKTINLWRIK